MWRRVAVSGTTVLLLLAIAGPAWAKGPEGASITGPGISDPIVIEGVGEFSNGSEFSQFVEATGFWNLVFGADSTGSRFGEVTTAPSTEDLGPSYIITWHLLDNRIPARVYPEAEGGPLVHLESGIPLVDFDTETLGGWFAAQPILLKLMSNYGVPVSGAFTQAVGTEPEPAPTVPPTVPLTDVTSSASPTLPLMLATVVLVGGGGIWWATRRRPRRVSVP